MPERKGGKLSLTRSVSNLDKILGFLLPFSQVQKEQNSIFICKKAASWVMETDQETPLLQILVEFQ